MQDKVRLIQDYSRATERLGMLRRAVEDAGEEIDATTLEKELARDNLLKAISESANLQIVVTDEKGMRYTIACGVRPCLTITAPKEVKISWKGKVE